MRRLFFVFTAVLLASLFIAGPSGAVSIGAGDFRLETTDWSMLDTGSGGSGPASNNFWSIMRVDTISDGNGNIQWRSGDNGEFISGVIGGLKLNHTTPVDGRSISYFAGDALSGTGPAYVRLFTNSADNFIGTPGRGFETGPNRPGAGTLGTFGGLIPSGTPWLSASFNPAALLADDSGLTGANGTDVYRVVNVSSTTLQTTGYLDVDPSAGIGSAINSGAGLAGSDLKMTSTVDKRNPLLAGSNGWNGISAGQVFGATAPAIPEPGTILLLGSGLIGIGIYAGGLRKK